MAAVVFYRAPTDGLGLRKLKKQKQKHTTMIKSDCFRKKLFIYLFKASSMRHKHPFLKKIDKMG